MDAARSLRGWLAALTVGLTLTLVILAVEKHIRLPSASFFRAAHQVDAVGATTLHRGVLLSVDHGMASSIQSARPDTTEITRKYRAQQGNSVAALMRRPPEPAASVVLHAPVAIDQHTALPLVSSGSTIDYLMEAMDGALSSPIRSVSTRVADVVATHHPAVGSQRVATLAAASSLVSQVAEPKALYTELANLKQLVDTPIRSAQSDSPGRASINEMLVSRAPRLTLPASESEAIRHWLVSTHTLLDQVVVKHGLEHSDSQSNLLELQKLSEQAREIGNTTRDHDLARSLISTGYSLQRRVTVWQSIQRCLNGKSVTSPTQRDPETARADLASAIHAVGEKIGTTGDAANWRKYLMLDELTAWASSQQDDWQAGNQLALITLSRLHWQRLSESQQRFLAQSEFEELGSHLLVWGRDAIDYRQLLSELETLEADPISRVRSQLAGSVQVLRLSREESQQQLAAALNDHYRNANLRLTISQQLIQRLLPADQVDSRPVRKKILGADTSGDSTVHTQLRVKLVPDSNAWNIGIGVAGDVVSMTRSSKGPAVFHSTSTAHIDSGRYVRLDPTGYQVTAEPTTVESQDYLRKMSTDFDGLPLIGDLARLLVREQFDQKRGLAKRITQRMIANEADAELDRRLEENLKKAERELSERLIGPLERLNLNPLVVAMSTTEDRLSIRYRVANEAQMAAHTARPRAPSDSLLSMQVHQTAINNTIDQLGLSGRLWTIPELYERLGQAFQGVKWQLPAEMDEGVKHTRIRFADTRPASVELIDGKLRLTLRIAEFSQGDRFHIERFIVSSTYVPAADGMTAELIRDGVVEIVSRYDRLKLRVIFAKIFVANPQIPLISESWAKDPRSEGLAVSQVEIRDGWLSVAISPADSQRAAEVTARAHQLRLLK